MVINPYIFKREPNTFIGGVAKLGGTGDNAPILTAADLAAKLGISESIIKGFKVVGEDVECRITSDYNLPLDCFQNNENIIFFNSHNVTSIGSDAFVLCTNLTSVEFPLATSIESRAFNSCTNLTSVEFPLVTSVGNTVFNSCSSLTSVEFPLATSVGSGAFRNCTNLTSVEFPLATSIDGFAFQHCTSLTSVESPLVTFIGNNAFYSCTGITSVEFPLVTSIGGSAFDLCTNLVEINIPLAKTLGFTAKNNDVFRNIALNAEINTNIFLKTADVGELEGDLLYAYTSRNATINFYDDNGNFVETYNPNPELYIQNDACSIGANETESIGAGWNLADPSIDLQIVESDISSYAIKITLTESDYSNAKIQLQDLEIGETYRVTCAAKCFQSDGINLGGGFFRTTESIGWDRLTAMDFTSTEWQVQSFEAIAMITNPILELYPAWLGDDPQVDWFTIIDNISIKKIS